MYKWRMPGSFWSTEWRPINCARSRISCFGVSVDEPKIISLVNNIIIPFHLGHSLTFVLKFIPQNAKNRILGLWNFKTFWARTCPDPLTPSPPPLPRKRGPAAACWYSRLLYSNLLATSIFIESPLKGGAYCERYVGTFSAFVYEKSLFFFLTILTIATSSEKLKTRSDTWLATSQSSSPVWIALILEIA